MKTVQVWFKNIQSHESTYFVIKPGLNFILAEDNNVGKSTIFRVLKRIALYPEIPAKKINELVRNGCDVGTATFKFDETVVRATFLKGTTSNVGRIVFELFEEDYTTRHSKCPECLLNALGIVRNDDFILNIMDADSVKLIASESNETDSTICKILLDEKVEKIKSNSVSLRSSMVHDYNGLQACKKSQESVLSRLSYDLNAVAFRSDYKTLAMLADIADKMEPVMGSVSKDKLDFRSEGIEVVGKMVDVADKLSCINSLSEREQSKPLLKSGELEALWVICNKMYDCLTNYKSEMSRKQVYHSDITCDRVLLSKLSSAHKLVEELSSLSNGLKSSYKELRELDGILSKETKQVQCPVKGKVFYSEQACVPSFN